MIDISRRRLILNGIFSGGMAIAAGISRFGASASQSTRSADVPYQFTTFDYPGAASTTLFGINEKGQMVGYYADGDDIVHAFVVEAEGERLTQVDHPDAGDTTVAFGINSTGKIAGYYNDPNTPGGIPGTVPFPEGGQYSFVWSPEDDSFTTIVPPDGVSIVVAFGINDADEVSGIYIDSKLAEELRTESEEGAFPQGTRGFVWSLDREDFVETEIDNRRGLGNTFVTGINDLGDVTGQYVGSDGVTHAFLRSYETGHYTMIEHVASDGGTCGQAVSNTGNVAGFYFPSDGILGYVWSPEDQSFTDIEHPDGINSTSAVGINTRGQIVGDFADKEGGVHGYMAKPGA